MRTRHFGKLPSGEPVEAFTLEGGHGVSVDFITYGGIVTSIKMPDRNGRVADVVLGFDCLEHYLTGHPFFGAITGRVAGRIPGGQFTVEGKTYELAKNDGPNHLHGGLRGLDKRVWKAESVERADGADSVSLFYRSPDGEEGYPGTVDFRVTYALTAVNVFVIESEVLADRTTPVSLTNHSYFNLGGEGSGDIFDHELAVFSDRVFEVDGILTPLGRLRQVSGGPQYLPSPRRMGDVVPAWFEEHGDCYALPGGDSLYHAASVIHPASGRRMDVSTNEYCLQIYTAAKLDCPTPGKSGRPFGRFAGLCLECEGYPGGVKWPEFGNILVQPGCPQRRLTHYAFSTF